MIRERLKSRNGLTLIVKLVGKLTTKQSIIIMCVNHRITKSSYVCQAKSTKMLYEMQLGNMKKGLIRNFVHLSQQIQNNSGSYYVLVMEKRVVIRLILMFCQITFHS